MGLPELANSIRKELSVNDIKIAAKEYGLTYFYFTQKIKSIDTNHKELLRAVESLLNAHNSKNDRVQQLYKSFLSEINDR
ncbi:hypothetical protein [Aquimarina latercula]|uniref:hypothetical protein n=1 Tax=Aquimarina latercula TaxID=987 RepID=UPI0003F5C99C|nr:hypothetical protein [Aquimarina latercula]